MVLEISRREVLNNLIRFKDSLLEKQAKKHPKGKRVYKVLLNRKTGDMRFPQKIRALEYHIARKKGKGEMPGDWKEIQIIVSQEAEAAHFEVQDAHNHRLEPTDIDPLAWRVTRETLEILNEKAKTVRGYAEVLPEEEVLKDLSSIHLLTPVDLIEDLPGWMGVISRIEAEKRLKRHGIGTYLFREADRLTLAMAVHLAEENHLGVQPFLLTVVEEEGKISEILLLKTAKGWTFYRDDPNLDHPVLYKYHPSPQALLHEISYLAKHPVSRGGL